MVVSNLDLKFHPIPWEKDPIFDQWVGSTTDSSDSLVASRVFFSGGFPQPGRRNSLRGRRAKGMFHDRCMNDWSIFFGTVVDF